MTKITCAIIARDYSRYLLGHEVTPDDLKHDYHFRDLVPDFAIGRRRHLRYALEMAYVYLTELNPKGPEPWEYLEYAQLDISSGDLRGAVNALGNVELRPKPLLDGHALIRLGAVPGPALGQLAQEMYITQLEGKLQKKEQAKQWVQKWLQKHREND